MTERFVLRRLKDVMWALAAAAVVLGVGRFAFGLAASTNMMDSLPWGWCLYSKKTPGRGKMAIFRPPPLGSRAFLPG